MTKAGDQDRGKILSRLIDRRLQARDVVIFEVQQVRAVFAGDAGHARRAPGQRAVIASLGDQHLAPTGAGPRDGHASRGRITAVLLEHRPVRMRHHRDEIFGQIHHDLAGAVQTIAERSLRLGRRLHFGVAMAEQHRPPAAHEVDIFAPVDVPHPASLGGGEELRITFRQPRSVEMSPHAAGHHALGSRPQHRIRALCFAQYRCWLVHGVLLVCACCFSQLPQTWYSPLR